MPPTETDPVIPDELAGALRRAAAAVPPADLHPTGPMLRLRDRRRRHRLVVAAGGLAAALTAVVAVNLGGSDEEDPPVVVGDNGAAPATGGTPDEQDLTSPLLIPGASAELMPDGTERPLPKAHPEDAPPGSLVRLADGRLATLSTPPPEGAEAGPVVGDIGDNGPAILTVFDAAGAPTGSKDIRQPDQGVQLIGEHDGKVVVQRAALAESPTSEAEFFTIDLDTFEESRIASDGGPRPVASAGAGRLVITHQEDGLGAADGPTGDESCWADVLELATGDSRRIGLPDCFLIGEAKVSADGRHLALVTDIAGGSDGNTTETTLQVVDLETGAILGGTPLPNPCANDPGGCTLSMAEAITWDDEDTVAAVVLTRIDNGAPQRSIVTFEVP